MRMFKRRQKAIRDEKRRLGIPSHKQIPEADFAYLQSGWERANQGKFIGTLEQVIEARALISKGHD